MAYAAIMTLKQNLQNILQHLQRYSNIPCDKKDIESLNAKVEFFQLFLEEYPSHESNAVTFLEGRIREAAYEADDLMDDLHLRNPSHDSKDFSSFMIKIDTNNEVTAERTNINQVAMKFDSLIVEVMKIKLQKGLEIKQGRGSFMMQEGIKIGRVGVDHEDFDARNGLVSSTTKGFMVGFEDRLMEIKEQLGEDSSTLKILLIVGMGGIGKTTLATHVHNDPKVVNHFDIRVWATVSQSYSVRDIMLGMLGSMGILTKEMLKASDAHLEIFVHKNFKDRRYLITLDDIWDTKAWKSLKKMFPDDNNRSRIMLTTRIAKVAEHAGPSWTHQLNPLKDEQSWMLLRSKVFVDKPCPLNLQEIGKTIARDCGGLPLSLVVIGGLLSRVEETQVAWQSVADNVTSLLISSGDQCSEILRLSYNYLPQYLKACFLYMGVFPKSHEVRVSKVAKMWVAEGFLGEADDQSPEDVAQRCVEELFDRSLILMSKRNFEGRIKAFRIHDLLLDFCLVEAKNEKFLQIPRSRATIFASHLTRERRISIHPMRKFKNYLIPSIFVSYCTPYLRSLVCVGKCSIEPRMFSESKLLRLLDVTQVVFPEFPHQVLELTNLRYIALTCNGDIPASITKLWNLQTLIIIRNRSGRSKYHLPVEIWSMTHLRHVRCDRAHLPDPAGLQIKHIVFENLQTLSGLLNLIFTEEVLQRIPNIKKIDVVYESRGLREWSDYQLENVGNYLHQLEALKIRVINPEIGLFPGRISPTRFEFPLPQSLKTLTLAGVGIPWDDLAVIGSLPYLQVLKLMDHACLGTEWRPNEEEFCELNTLVLEGLKLKHWEADSCHFPSLQRLIIRRCGELEQIPSGMGESLPLEVIELRDCKASVFDSAKNIQKQQVNNGISIGFRVIWHETSGWHEVSQVVNDVLLPLPRLSLYCFDLFTRSRGINWRRMIIALCTVFVKMYTFLYLAPWRAILGCNHFAFFLFCLYWPLECTNRVYICNFIVHLISLFLFFNRTKPIHQSSLLVTIFGIWQMTI